MAEQPGPGDVLGSGGVAFSERGTSLDPREPAGAAGWREIPVRSVTAANRWADVTRGGMPAGVNRDHRPGSDGFPPSGFPPGRRLPERDNWAHGQDQGHPADRGPGERHGGFGAAVPDDIPFQGARPIDVSAPRNHQPRRGPAYSAAAAASAAPGTTQRRSETGALRRIKESGAIRAIMDTGAMRTLMDTTAMQILRERYAGKGRVVAIAGACFWALVAVGATWLALTHGG
jgi:hypothetical protein